VEAELYRYVMNTRKNGFAVSMETMAKEEFPQEIVVRVQKSGWMTKDLVDDWIKSVWFRRPGALLRQRSMLVSDKICEGPIATREMRPGIHTRRHGRDVAAT
jgi:hypothetical protein